MRRLWVQFLAVFVKEVRQTAQDKRIMVLLTFVPVIQLMIFGFAINLDVDHIPTAVVDMDRTVESRSLIQGVMADGTLEDVAHYPDVPAADRALEQGSAAAVLVIPKDFARDLARREPTALQMIVDGTDPTRTSIAIGALSGFVSQRMMQLAGGPRGPAIQVQTRLLYNPTSSTAIYMVPGIAGMLLLMITTVVTSMGLAREREVGTLEQVRVTPLPTGILMLGKVAPFVMVGLLDVTAAIVLGAWVFEVPIRGSVALFYLVTAAYLLTTVGVGLLVSSIAETQQQAFIGAFMFMLPAMLLSGTMTPIHAMPEWLQPLTMINPLRFYTEAVRGILLKGSTAIDLWVPISLLVVYGLGVIALASSRFRKRLA